MQEVIEFAVPENAVDIDNPQLRDLVLEDIGIKGDNLAFLDREGRELRFPVSEHAFKQFGSYKQTLINWANNPFNPEQGADGHGYALFLTKVLQGFFADKADIVVRQTPFTVDFLSSNDNAEWGVSGDIVIARHTEQGLRPLLFVSAKLGDWSYKTAINRKLQIPVLTLAGDRLFLDGENVTFLFAAKQDTRAFIDQQTALVREKLLQVFAAKIAEFERWLAQQ